LVQNPPVTKLTLLLNRCITFVTVDLWLNYLDYLKQHQSLDFISVSRTHSRALHALESDELKRFNTECAVKNFT
jgi:hypothetical protein